jgi:tRNA modification GTPase
MDRASRGVSTIFAPATGTGPAGIAVLRISGPQAQDALRALGGRVDRPRHALRAEFHDPRSGEVLDRGLALVFPAPRSFTGEDVVELHLHGGRAVMAAMLDALGAIPELRLAEPGEFSRRAFEHGKLDLTEAEAIAAQAHQVCPYSNATRGNIDVAVSARVE